MKLQNMNLIKTSLAAAVLALALTASAFQEDKPRGTNFGPEQSQQQLAQQQALQGRVDPVGVVEEKTSPNTSATVESSEGSNSFAAADAAKVKASFANANTTIAEKQKPNNVVGLLMLVVGALVLAAVGFKNYSDKVVPLPKSLQ